MLYRHFNGHQDLQNIDLQKVYSSVSIHFFLLRPLENNFQLYWSVNVTREERWWCGSCSFIIKWLYDGYPLAKIQPPCTNSLSNDLARLSYRCFLIGRVSMLIYISYIYYFRAGRILRLRLIMNFSGLNKGYCYVR